MRTIEIQGKRRDQLGKRSTKFLRREAMVPAIVLDNGKATHVSLDYLSAQSILYTPHKYIVNLSVEGEQYDVIIRDAQFHPVTDKILHIDFLRISKDKEVEVALPVKLIGTPAGVKKGGKVAIKMRLLKVMGIPYELPEALGVNVESLELGGTIKVRDLDIKGITITSPASTAIATVEIPRSLRSAQTKAAAEERKSDK